MATNTTDAQQVFDQWRDKIVPWTYDAGYVTLSYLVSLIGSLSTLELINRRTAPRGKFNHLMLISAAVTMGGIAIWCMHYVGNRALYMADGQQQLQIAYSSGFTSLSFVMPIVVLLAAFVAIGTNDHVSWWRVAIGGALAGAAICGMHYLGNAAINNYVCIYNASNVVGAALISVAASIIALSLFFVFRASWTNLWWKRGISAVLLASAVSGMHWCASAGTRYRLVSLGATDQLTRNTTVVVVICLSVGACLMMAGFTVWTARIMQRSANKAQQVLLAAAVFDKHGRVLVSPDGLLPSEKITDSFLEKTPQDSFTVAHPMFHWMFQASRNWSSITGILGGITNHLTHLPHSGRDSSREGIKLTTDHGELIENYDIIFRELFCAAAAGLADKMKIPLTNVGILWDVILPTGGGVCVRARHQDVEHLVDGDKIGPRREALPHGINMTNHEDLAEKGLFRQQYQDFGRGSLMFLVRRVETSRDMDSLAAAGYRFAELHQVSGIIGSTMQIKTRSIEDKLRDMSDYAEENAMLEPGVHLAFFGVRARVNNAYGFDVLARRHARNLLPSVQLPLTRLDAWQINFLRQFERMTPRHVARRLDNLKHQTPKEMMFASQLSDGIEFLRGWVEDSIFDEGVLCSKTVEIPCRPSSPGSAPGTCTVIAFRIVIPIHLTIESPECEFVPLNLFKVHQLVYKDSSNHIIFARSVHREIAPIINAVPVVTSPSKPSGVVTSHSRRRSLRDVRMSSQFFRLGRQDTSDGADEEDGAGAVGADGSPIPTVIYRTPSRAGSGKSGSTGKLWNGRCSSGGEVSSSCGSADSGPDMKHGLHGRETATEELYLRTSAYTAAPTGPPPPPSPFVTQTMSPSNQQTSFGGIMVSQEITVNVQTAGDVPDTSAGNNFGSNARKARSREGTLLRRRTGDDGTPGTPGTPGAGGEATPAGLAPHGEARRAVTPQSVGGTAATGGGGAQVGIEMRSMASDRSSVHLGPGVQVSNVEAENLTEVPTFVDELFGFCVEGR